MGNSVHNLYCSLSFEQGRYDYFDIPRNFAEISPALIAGVASGTVFVLSIVFFILYVAEQFRTHTNRCIRYIADCAPLMVILSWIAWVASNSILSILIACIIALVIARDRSGTPGTGPLNTESKRDKISKAFVLLLALILLPATFLGVGKNLQSRAPVLTVLTEDKTAIVVGKSGNSYVIKHFDQKSGLLRKGFETRSLDDTVSFSKLPSSVVSRDPRLNRFNDFNFITYSPCSPPLNQGIE